MNKSLKNLFLWVIGFSILPAITAPTAMALPTYSSFARVQTNSGTDLETGGQTAEASYSTGFAAAYLEPGAMLLLSENAGPQTRGDASGHVSFGDLIFSRLAGYESNPDTFEGTLHATLNTDAIPGNSSASITLRDAVTGFGGSDSTFDTGFALLAVTISSLEVGNPYEILFNASVRTTTGSPDDAFLTLVLGGSPVFDLPEGYTVNSADGIIVNNFYQGSIPGAAVPEPATMFLLGSGLVGFARFRKRA